MNKYFVHVYHVVRSKISIEANNHRHAMELADDYIPAINSANVSFDVDNEFQGQGVVHHTESADEITGYLVDEVGDEEYRNTQGYLADGSPDLGAWRYDLTGRQRDTVLAALRCWQDKDRKAGELWEIACNDHDMPLNDNEIDALCEQLNV